MKSKRKNERVASTKQQAHARHRHQERQRTGTKDRGRTGDTRELEQETQFGLRLEMKRTTRAVARRERRGTPRWRVLGLLLVLAFLGAGSFVFGLRLELLWAHEASLQRVHLEPVR